MGEKAISFGRLYSCIFGVDGVSSVSSSRENTLSLASVGSISQSWSKAGTMRSGRTWSHVLFLPSSLVASSSRLSRLSQLGSSGRVSKSTLNWTALLPVPLGLSAASVSKVSQSWTGWSESAPCCLTGAVLLGEKELSNTSWDTSWTGGVSRPKTLSLTETAWPCFSALSSSRALRHELFTSSTKKRDSEG